MLPDLENCVRNLHICSDSQLFSDNKNHDLEKMDSIGPLPGPITSIDAALSVVRVETQKPGHVRTRRYTHCSLLIV